MRQTLPARGYGPYRPADRSLAPIFSARLRYPVSGLVVTVKNIEERPDEVKRVIKAGINANRYIHPNREVSLNEVADLSILREAQKELGIKGK